MESNPFHMETHNLIIFDWLIKAIVQANAETLYQALIAMIECASWWCHMRILSALLYDNVITCNIFRDTGPLYEGNPTVTDGFPPKRDSNTEFDVVVFMSA